MTTLKIDGLEVANQAALAFTQTYDDDAALDFRRTADGSGYLRSSWADKLRTTIAGRGWAPTALERLDRTLTHTIECATPRARSVAAPTLTVTLPAARRNDTDHVPIAFAMVDEELTRTTISNLAALNAYSTNDATLVAVTGATLYQVSYWPKFTGAILRRSGGTDALGNFTWQLELAEV